MSIPEDHTAIIPFPNGDIILSAQEARHWRAYRQALDPTILLGAQEAAQEAARSLAQAEEMIRSAAQTMTHSYTIFQSVQEAFCRVKEEFRQEAALNERVIAAIPRSPTEPGDIYRPEGMATDTEFLIAHTDWDKFLQMCAIEGFDIAEKTRTARIYHDNIGPLAVVAIYKTELHTLVRVTAPEITPEKLRTAMCHRVLTLLYVLWVNYLPTYCDSGTLLAAASPQPAQIAVVSQPMKDRERRIAEFYGKGHTDAEIAEKTGIPLKTVNNTIPILRAKYPQAFPYRKND